MINSSSMNYLPIYNQNYNPNMRTISINFINSGIEEQKSINSIYPKKIIHRANSALILTTQIYPINNRQLSISPPKQISPNRKIYISPISHQINNNEVSYINQNYQNQNNLSMNNHNSFQNFNSLNITNIGNIVTTSEDKEDLTFIRHNSNSGFANNTYFYGRNKLTKIPHSIFLNKRIFEAKQNNNINNRIIENKYNVNYINYYNSSISPNIRNLNNYRNNFSSNNIFNKMNNNLTNKIKNEIQIEPDKNSKLSDFTCIKKIGKGSEGIIYCVKWKRNNKNYAIKKCQIKSVEVCKRKKHENLLIKNFIEKNKCDGILKIYASLCTKNDIGNLIFYEILELADKDWEKEIIERKANNLYYNEIKLIDILRNLIKVFSLLQSNHITHRDIKPQNIMILNGNLKICDFGNIRILKGEGNIIQRVRGSELFMSPILFKGYKANIPSVKHNTYKSDVFSLGMCMFFASTLSYEGPCIIREIYNMDIIKKVLNKYLSERYTQNFINIIYIMLQIEENKRPDFNKLEVLFKSYFD